MKTCKKCNQVKPFESYTTDIRYKDGYYPWCFECRKAWRDARKDKQRELHKNWSDRNREHVREMANATYHRHKDEYSAKRREYDRQRWATDTEYRERKRNEDRERYHTNPATQERKKEAHKRFYHQHYRTDPKYRKLRLERGKIHARRRRFRIKGTGDRYSITEWRALCAQYDHRCLCCGELKPLSPDHIVPLSRGGANTIDNIQPLCALCNMQKATKTIDYRPARGD